MSVVIASTTEPQEFLDHAAESDWRTAPVPEIKTEEAKPAVKAEGEQKPPAAEAKPGAEAKPATEKKDEKNENHGERRWKRLTKTLNELSAQSQADRDRADRLERELAELRNGKPTAKVEEKNAAPAVKPKPKQSDFTGPNAFDDYNEALMDWKIEQRDAAKKPVAEEIKDALTQEEQQAQQQEQEERSREILTAHAERVAEARVEHEDWDEVVVDKVRVPESAQLAIVRRQNSAEILYYLGRNPNVAASLFELEPIDVVGEIAVISKQLAAENGKPVAEKPKPAAQAVETPAAPAIPPKPPKPVSSAPAPIRPVGGASARVSKDIHDKDISYDDYRRIRNQQERDNARR